MTTRGYACRTYGEGRGEQQCSMVGGGDGGGKRAGPGYRRGRVIRRTGSEDKARVAEDHRPRNGGALVSGLGRIAAGVRGGTGACEVVPGAHARRGTFERPSAAQSLTVDGPSSGRSERDESSMTPSLADACLFWGLPAHVRPRRRGGGILIRHRPLSHAGAQMTPARRHWPYVRTSQSVCMCMSLPELVSKGCTCSHTASGNGLAT